MGDVVYATFSNTISGVIQTQINQLNDPEGYTPSEVKYTVEEGKHSLTLTLHIVTVKTKHPSYADRTAVEVYLRTFANVFKCEYADALYIHKEVMKAFIGKERPSHSLKKRKPLTVNRVREGYVAVYKNNDFVVFISDSPYS